MWQACLALVLLAAACDKPTVADRIAALRKSGRSFMHTQLPSPERLKELYPGTEGLWRDTHGREHLRADENAAAILDAGQAAVPELIPLLEDPERGALAAVFLAEIGGKKAAAALLARWRELRGTLQDKSAYLLKEEKTRSLGIWCEGDHVEVYHELIFALCYTGRDVGAEVAADTRATMDEAERLHSAGAVLLFKEFREQSIGRVELRWHAEPIETAQEGLKVLAMAGVPEGVDLFVRALRSPVRAIRLEAIQQVGYLGQGLDRTIPLLGALLDDPEWRRMAIEQLSTLVFHEMVEHAETVAEQEALAARYKRRLQELGHLPK